MSLVYDLPAAIASADEEVLWAVIALRKAHPEWSNRRIARTAGCSHPHVAKLLAGWSEDPETTELYLEAAGFLA